MKKAGFILIAGTFLLAIAMVLADRLYVTKLKQQFTALEKERIEVSNGLATAKIVHENLNHVRDLVFENMDFPNQKDSIGHEEHIFNLITTCVNDLKLKLISLKPLRPTAEGPVTTHAYDMEVAGDFFKFGELCAKFENSRRIISVESYAVALSGQEERRWGGPQSKTIRVKMRINTFRVKKL